MTTAEQERRLSELQARIEPRGGMVKTMRYVTENSIYEVRFSEPPTVRRVEGTDDPTPRFADSDGWHQARAVLSSDTGLTILWPTDPTGVLRNATVTSPVRYTETIEVVGGR